MNHVCQVSLFLLFLFFFISLLFKHFIDLDDRGHIHRTIKYKKKKTDDENEIEIRSTDFLLNEQTHNLTESRRSEQKIKQDISSQTTDQTQETEKPVHLDAEGISSSTEKQEKKITREGLERSYFIHQVDSKLLTSKEKLLEEEEWLNDSDILNFMNKLKHKFPQVVGLEDPIVLSHAPEGI